MNQLAVLAHKKLPYTDPQAVESIAVEPAPSTPNRQYGSQIPTEYVMRYKGRKRRVYHMSYGNAASYWIRVNRQEVFLDADTAQRVRNMA